MVNSTDNVYLHTEMTLDFINPTPGTTDTIEEKKLNKKIEK